MSEWHDEIEALERESVRAFLSADVASLDRLFSDSLLVNSPINRVHDKQTVLELLQKGLIAHCRLESSPELIARDGDIIVVMGSDTVQDTPEAPTLRRRFTNVWRREGDAWRLFARHANIIPN